MKWSHLGAIGAMAMTVAVSTAGAQINWTSWTAATPGSTTGTATGTLGSVVVTYRGEVGSGTQTNNTGSVTPWRETGTPLAFAGEGPTTTDFVQLTGGGNIPTNTLTFSSPVNNLFMSIASLGSGGTNAQFDFATSPTFTIFSQGAGNWGGTATSLTQSGSTLFGTEGNGLLQFNGPVSTLTWTNPAPEYYYGFSVGTSTVPEPSSIALLGTGLFGLVPMVRRRRK